MCFSLSLCTTFCTTTSIYRDYGHTALYSNEIALQISFYFSHVLYNLDQLMYLFVDKSLVSYATMHITNIH